MKKAEDKQKYEDKLDTLFNLASCTHPILPCTEAECPGCKEGAHLMNCTCKKEKRIPNLELKFVMVMREVRPPGQKARMLMGPKDVQESKRQNKALDRQANQEAAASKRAEQDKAAAAELEERGRTDELLLQEIGAESRGEEIDLDGGDAGLTTRNTMQIPHTALAAIRFFLLLQLLLHFLL